MQSMQRTCEPPWQRRSPPPRRKSRHSGSRMGARKLAKLLSTPFMEAWGWKAWSPRRPCSTLRRASGLQYPLLDYVHIIDQVPRVHNPWMPGTVTKSTRRRGAPSWRSFLASAHRGGSHWGASAWAFRRVGQQGGAAQPRCHPAEQPPLQCAPHDPVCVCHCSPQLWEQVCQGVRAGSDFI